MYELKILFTNVPPFILFVSVYNYFLKKETILNEFIQPYKNNYKLNVDNYTK